MWLRRIAASVFSDLWVPCTVFSLLLAALVTGVLKLINSASISNTLMISLVWVVYNMIPQYLLIHYTWVGRGGSLRVRALPHPATPLSGHIHKEPHPSARERTSASFLFSTFAFKCRILH